MKKYILWILGVVEICIGLPLWISAQSELNDHPIYYALDSESVSQLVVMKIIGIALVVSGVFWILLKLYQTRFTESHMTDVTPVVKQGGFTACPSCGLSLTADSMVCPRCGAQRQSAQPARANPVSTFGAVGAAGAAVNRPVPAAAPPAQKSGFFACPTCGLNLSANLSTCPRCGTPRPDAPSADTNAGETAAEAARVVDVFCGNCGFKLKEGAKFCPQCGQKRA